MRKHEEILSDRIKKAITDYLKKKKMPNHKFTEFKITVYPTPEKINSEFQIKVEIQV